MIKRPLALVHTALLATMTLVVSGRAGPAAANSGGSPTSWHPGTPDVIVATAEPGLKLHFPSAVVLDNGHILVSAREAESHVGGDGRIVTTRSTDGGNTWEPLQVVFDSPSDERAPMVSQVSSGRIFLSWWDADGVYVASSHDGQNWTAPIEVGTSMSKDLGGWAAHRSRVVEAPDGSLLIGLYGQAAGDTSSRAMVSRSLDDGRTWDALDESVIYAGDTAVSEPLLTVLPDGSIITLLRRGNDLLPEDRLALTTRSFDSGRTWTEPEQIDLAASSADAAVLSDGRVFLAYGDRSGRYSGVRLTTGAVIQNPAKPWIDPPRTAIWDALVEDQANPSVVEVSPGHVLVFGFDVLDRTIVATRVPVEEVVSDADKGDPRRIDVLSLVEKGKASVATDLNAADPQRPEIGPLSAVDGELGVYAAAIGAEEAPADYQLNLGTRHALQEVGVSLRPGQNQSGVVEMSRDGQNWTQVGQLDVRYRWGDLEWFKVPGSMRKAAHVRVRIETLATNHNFRQAMLSELALRGVIFP